MAWHARRTFQAGRLLAIERDRGADTLGHRRCSSRIADRILDTVRGPARVRDLNGPTSWPRGGRRAGSARGRPAVPCPRRLPAGRASVGVHPPVARQAASASAGDRSAVALTYDETALVTTLILGPAYRARWSAPCSPARTASAPHRAPRARGASGPMDARSGRPTSRRRRGRRARAVCASSRDARPSPAPAPSSAAAFISECRRAAQPPGDLTDRSRSRTRRSSTPSSWTLLRLPPPARDALYGTVQAGERGGSARAAEFGGLIEGASSPRPVHFERAGMHREAYRAALAGARAANAVSAARGLRAVRTGDRQPRTTCRPASSRRSTASTAPRVRRRRRWRQRAPLARRHHLAAGQLVEAAFDLLSLAGSPVATCGRWTNGGACSPRPASC
jgi:hypothetical protein